MTATAWRAEAIPAAMRAVGRWVAWRPVCRDGRATKVPVDVLTGRGASSTDPLTWADFQTAARYARAHGLGVGFVLGVSWVGVDLDHVLDDETGALTADARRIVEALESYAEISPGGTGAHILCRGVLPAGRRRKGFVEMYDRGRYFTVTGAHLPETPAAVNERTAELAAVHARWIGAAPAMVSQPVHVHQRVQTRGRGAVIDEARRRYGVRFDRLWAGDWSAYGSQSEADLAACAMLAACGAGAGEIAALVAQSGLSRPKWERDDYRARTIDTALAGAQAALQRAARFSEAVERRLGL